MTLLNSPSCCFLNCLELAFGACAATADRDYRAAIGADADTDLSGPGYHPSIVLSTLLERYGTAITEIDIAPVGEDGNTVSTEATDMVVSWFKRPGFEAIVTGPRNTNGEEHANAFRNGVFVDSNGVQLDEPNIKIRSVWCFRVPKEVEPC